MAAAMAALWACVVAAVGFSGWFVVASVWGEDPDPPGVVFAGGVALCVAGCVAVAASSFASVLPCSDSSAPEPGAARALRLAWTAGALCAMAGLLVLVGLGVVMTVLSHLTAGGKVFVGVLFALCSLIPLAPGYEIWRRRADAKAA